MGTVAESELPHHGNDVLAKVEAGEPFIVTRGGAQIAELRPLRRRAVPTRELIARRSSLPLVNPMGLQSDIDSAASSATVR